MQHTSQVFQKAFRPQPGTWFAGGAHYADPFWAGQRIIAWTGGVFDRSFWSFKPGTEAWRSPGSVLLR